MSSFFLLHKSDRRVLLALLAVAVVIVAAISLLGGGEAPTPLADNTVPADTLLQAQADAEEEPAPPAAEHFAFDPNTADSAALRRLGLSSYIISNIYHYRQAGGVFSTKEDFARLYGLTVKQYRQLEPYITIAPDYRPAASLFPKKASPSSQSAQSARSPQPAQAASSAQSAQPSAARPARSSFKLSPGETLDLSTADTTMLMRIPGIGPYYARRIADYRERLGGYVSLDQLDEIDDLPPEAKAYLTLGQPTVRRININRATLNELKRHPYINYYQARAITDYRRQHGAVSSLQDLRLLQPFTAEDLQRMEPYVEY